MGTDLEWIIVFWWGCCNKAGAGEWIEGAVAAFFHHHLLQPPRARDR